MEKETKKINKRKAIVIVVGANIIFYLLIGLLIFNIFGKSSREKYFEKKMPLQNKAKIATLVKDATITKDTVKFIGGQVADTITYDYDVKCTDNKFRTVKVILYYDKNNKTDKYTRIDYYIDGHLATAIDFLIFSYGENYNNINFINIGVMEDRDISLKEENQMKKDSIMLKQ